MEIALQAYWSIQPKKLIKQIEFYFDLIEVVLPCGTCFRISERKFVHEPTSDDGVGKVSPQKYVPYDSSTPPNPKHFRESILNSFPEDYDRANFLNKFYRCLMAGRMPHKVRKLVVNDLKDSGKTTRASISLGIIPMKFVASVTQEAQFSLSMINEDTLLAFLDEWSHRTLASDMAKVVLQGGFMVQAIKHGKRRSMGNRIPFYITTNELCYFGNDDVNVTRRIRVFTTKSLDLCKTNVDRWIKDNPMDYIVWCAQEIGNLLDLVDSDERWYEKDAPSERTVRIFDRGIFTGVDLSNGAVSLVFDIDKVKSLDSKDLQEKSQMDDTAVRQLSDFLHHNFKQAANSALELAKEKIYREKQHEQTTQRTTFSLWY